MLDDKECFSEPKTTVTKINQDSVWDYSKKVTYEVTDCYGELLSIYTIPEYTEFGKKINSWRTGVEVIGVLVLATFLIYKGIVYIDKKHNIHR